MSNNAHELSKRLLNALDNSYNVVDMHAVNEIISILEKIHITKELLETTRLGKHVNELRRKTSDPTLARRAKVLVKRWRDLVIPSATTASPGHINIGSNRSSAERQTRRLGGTPLTSPALQRHVVSPAVHSPMPPRPTWGGYESDSQDVILVDDDPDPPPTPLSLATPAAALLTPPKRPTSPTPSSEEKKSKRDKKLKKKRGRGRAGSGSEAAAEWSGRNGSSSLNVTTAHGTNVTTAHGTAANVTTAHGTAANVTTAHGTAANVTTAHGTTPNVTTPHVGRPRKNGCKNSIDAYTALVHKMPRAGGKKVKTTVELLSEIQSRGVAAVASPPPASPASPDVMLIEPEPSPVPCASPLRNGTAPPSPHAPLEDPRPHHECTCNEEFADEDCPAARNYTTAPLHIRALHEAYLPGINGTRAPPHPHQFAVRKPENEDYPGLFSSVVPLYKYSDYADDYCVKNMSKVPLCTHLNWKEFAPNPPSPPPFNRHPTPRPYPIEDLEIAQIKEELKEDSKSPEAMDVQDIESELSSYVCPKIEAEMVSVPVLEPSERLKAPILTNEEKSLVIKSEIEETNIKVISELETSGLMVKETDHRTVERTKVSDCLDGRTLYQMCGTARDSIRYDYSQTSSTPVVTLPLDVPEAEIVLDNALESVTTDLDAFGKPARSTNFTEWHECAKLGDLIALPYVVID